MIHRGLLLFSVIAVSLTLWTGCVGGRSTNVYAAYTGGDAGRGAKVIERYRCGACHVIPGIDNANGLVGPPLTWWSKRTFIAGEIPNQPENLVHWIVSPTSIEPKTAMPALGLSEQEARDAAAYLYTLR